MKKCGVLLFLILESEKFSKYEDAAQKLDELKSEIQTVQKQIDELAKEKAPRQNAVDGLSDNYDKLSQAQKARISGYEEAIALRDCEISAIQAVNKSMSFS